MAQEITITLSEEEARLIQDRVDSGSYVSPADYVKTLLQTELGVDPEWMPSDEVLKALVKESINDPQPSLTSEQVHRQLLEHHERHMAELTSKIAR